MCRKASEDKESEGKIWARTELCEDWFVNRKGEDYLPSKTDKRSEGKIWARTELREDWFVNREFGLSICVVCWWNVVVTEQVKRRTRR